MTITNIQERINNITAQLQDYLLFEGGLSNEEAMALSKEREQLTEQLEEAPDTIQAIPASPSFRKAIFAEVCEAVEEELDVASVDRYEYEPCLVVSEHLFAILEAVANDCEVDLEPAVGVRVIATDHLEVNNYFISWVAKEGHYRLTGAYTKGGKA